MVEMLDVNGVELAVETFGEHRHPAVLLIGGGGASMDWWDTDFCRRLAQGMRFVIRYDHRDTGQSVHYPPGEPGYGFADLVSDALGVLDALGVPQAHVAGISMGGTIAQHLAAAHTDRFRSLMLLSTPMDGVDIPMSRELTEFFATATSPEWTDDNAVAEYIVEAERLFETSEFFDENSVRALAERVVARAKNFASTQNHATLGHRDRPGEITLPTLIVHGTADPLYPYGHAEALARAIPGAELLPMAGAGHQAPPHALWDKVIPAMLRHTSGGWRTQADLVAARSLERGDATGWFDRLYSAGISGEVPMPWDRDTVAPWLADWAKDRTFHSGHAVVVGCGLGADAEFIAELGLTTTAFDVSPTAVEIARDRHPDSTVDYHVADLLDPPTEFSGAFDLVVEVFTVQAMPRSHRAAATASVRRLVAPGGTLLVIASRGEADGSGPPWGLTREEIEAFAAGDITVVRIEEPDLWRAEFRRRA